MTEPNMTNISMIINYIKYKLTIYSLNLFIIFSQIIFFLKNQYDSAFVCFNLFLLFCFYSIQKQLYKV